MIKFWFCALQQLSMSNQTFYRGSWRKDLKPNKKRAVPERWENYTPFLDPIAGERFIAFKVPLKPDIAIPEADGSLFTPSSMLESFQARGIDVGLIVDLTNTDKYYSASIVDGLFRANNVEHYKLPTRGQVVPSQKIVREFQRVVDEFLKRDPHRLVGVHCTHGLNRTGYLICRYLVERRGWAAQDAIVAFDRARGHPQERKPYLDSLRSISAQKLRSHGAPARMRRSSMPNGGDFHRRISQSRQVPSRFPADHSTSFQRNDWRARHPDLVSSAPAYIPYERFDPHRSRNYSNKQGSGFLTRQNRFGPK